MINNGAPLEVIQSLLGHEKSETTKMYAELFRFQSLLQDLYNSNQCRFTNVAAKYGYSNQSHFINHFKRYYGISPNQVFKINSTT